MDSDVSLGIYKNGRMHKIMRSLTWYARDNYSGSTMTNPSYRTAQYLTISFAPNGECILEKSKNDRYSYSAYYQGYFTKCSDKATFFKKLAVTFNKILDARTNILNNGYNSDIPHPAGFKWDGLTRKTDAMLFNTAEATGGYNSEKLLPYPIMVKDIFFIIEFFQGYYDMEKRYGTEYYNQMVGMARDPFTTQSELTRRQTIIDLEAERDRRKEEARKIYENSLNEIETDIEKRIEETNTQFNAIIQNCEQAQALAQAGEAEQAKAS